MFSFITTACFGTPVVQLAKMRLLSNFFCIYQFRDILEPPNNGHFGDEQFVRCREIVHSSKVSIIGGSTVLTITVSTVVCRVCG